jgi:ATP phosphoribosyltransferase
MSELNNKYIKLAIQKEGRLTENTLEFLRRSGLEFESYRQKLFTLCRNFPLEILYVRDNDILDYVSAGTVELGILGQNLLYEQRPKIRKLLNLRFGYCSLIVAVPKESKVREIGDLNGKRIATSYPQSAKIFFDKYGISIKIVPISGSVEIAPILGIADAIVDLTSTGSTLMLNDLRYLAKIYDSEAVLIANSKTMSEKKSVLVERLITRFKGVLSAKKYKYIMMKVPLKKLAKIIKLIPSLKYFSNSPGIKEKEIMLSSVINEDSFWDLVERLKKLEVAEISVLPIEKMII